MNDRVAGPWVPFGDGSVDLHFETLLGSDVKSVLRDLKSGSSVKLPAYNGEPSRVISINDLDPGELDKFNDYLDSYPWEKWNSGAPVFRYIGGKYMPIHENASPEAVMTRFASVLKGRIREAVESGKPIVFLGGECDEDNDWRQGIMEEFEDKLALVDPFDEDWEPNDNIPDELAALLQADHVVFYKGGKGTEKEKEFLDTVGDPEDYKSFDDLGDLKVYLGNLSKRTAKTANSEGQYDSSTTQVDLPKDLAEEVIAWGKKNVSDADIKEDEDNTAGREDEMHVTLLYGLKPKEVTDKLRSIVESMKPFDVRLGLVTVFKDSDKQDVVKIDAEASELQDMHYAIERAVPNVNSYPTYVPHITIAYVKKGHGDKVLGDDTFRGRTFKVDRVVFKSSDKDVTEIPLRGSAA